MLRNGTLVRNKRNGRRAVVVFSNESTVILHFAFSRVWYTTPDVINRNYTIV